jgi:hypothetical protein
VRGGAGQDRVRAEQRWLVTVAIASRGSGPADRGGLISRAQVLEMDIMGRFSNPSLIRVMEDLLGDKGP